ncbi:MAG: lysozyme M1 (1,4-beta-N-acetylmuramidase), partial [bacterium]
MEVKRPSGEPVVTGTVAFRRSPVEGGGPVVKVEQSPIRDRAGIWTLTLKNLPAGLTQGYVAFVDQTGTHLENRQD